MPDPEVVVIDEPDDLLSATFTRWAARRGTPVTRLRLAEAARAVSVTVDGDRAEVAPTWSLLLRPLRAATPPAGPDERFAWSEALATIWSAAALTSRPAVNRPDAWGWVSRSGGSVARSQRRAGWPSQGDEVYWHRLPPSGLRYHQDLDTWQTSDHPEAIAFGRSRALPPARGWDRVVVVGREAFRVTAAGTGGRDVAGESIELAGRLSLTFATVSWAVPARGGPAWLARVNPFPTFEECRPVLTEVYPSLLRRLVA